MYKYKNWWLYYYAILYVFKLIEGINCLENRFILILRNKFDIYFNKKITWKQSTRDVFVTKMKMFNGVKKPRTADDWNQ